MESEIIIAIKKISILVLSFHMVTDGHPHRKEKSKIDMPYKKIAWCGPGNYVIIEGWK